MTSSIHNPLGGELQTLFVSDPAVNFFLKTRKGTIRLIGIFDNEWL